MKVLGIDQSMTATGLCVYEGGDAPCHTETVCTSAVVGMQRLGTTVGAITRLLAKQDPQVVVMEEYAMGAVSTNNLTMTAELGGVIKWEAHRLGFLFGYGTSKNRDEEQQALRAMMLAVNHGRKVLVVQPPGTMKKFMLGKGDVSKDSRYLLTVQEKLGMSFRDDNQADAYMHACMAYKVMGVLAGRISFDDLSACQQEAVLNLLAVRTKGGPTTARMMKMSAAEKLSLIKGERHA